MSEKPKTYIKHLIVMKNDGTEENIEVKDVKKGMKLKLVGPSGMPLSAPVSPDTEEKSFIFLAVDDSVDGGLNIRAWCKKIDGNPYTS